MQKINHSEKFFTKQNPTGITLNPTSLPNFIFWIELGAINQILGFPGDSVVKTAPANAGDTSLILGSGRSLEEEMAALLYTVFSNAVFLLGESYGQRSMAG